jgi:hypothetical protein
MLNEVSTHLSLFAGAASTRRLETDGLFNGCIEVLLDSNAQQRMDSSKAVMAGIRTIDGRSCLAAGLTLYQGLLLYPERDQQLLQSIETGITTIRGAVPCRCCT